MHFDFTINIPTVLILFGMLSVGFKIWFIIWEYPPHRHENGLIIYPRGMSPDKVRNSEREHERKG